MDVGDIINQYLEEANLDTDLDRLEVITTQERLVNNKHKWSARLINHKINLSNFKFKRESALEDRITEFQNTEPVRVSRNIAERAVRNKKEIKVLDLKIKNEQLIIDYLENIYKNISFATNDIKNLVELMKLETQ
ncbi:hypothetical protein CMI37_21350 [Candidatus Pacearchaeota archaeon]|nr:hypothetical protein [Candidatus Pacearchaeota archaeon]|tara:strand:+ start:1688 stop:2092 length:405 start_codon:yes stop_codon:yes gene_type:complete